MTQLKDLKQRIERIKAMAVLDPSYENVRSYMTIQKQMMERSAAFSKRWMEVVYTNPNLDETIKNPTAQAARHVFHEQNRKKLEASIAGLSKTHGLFFFFSSNCQYCAEFAPIVQAFSQKYGWEVLAISIDGGTLKEYPSPRFDNGSAKTLGLQSVPALLAIEPKTGQIIPLSFGMSTHDQIEDRIRVLVLEKERNR